MANRSSDRTSSTPAASPPVRGGRAVFIVATDPAFLDRVLRECEDAPAGVARYSNLDQLSQALGQLERLRQLIEIGIARYAGRCVLALAQHAVEERGIRGDDEYGSSTPHRGRCGGCGGRAIRRPVGHWPESRSALL